MSKIGLAELNRNIADQYRPLAAALANSDDFSPRQRDNAEARIRSMQRLRADLVRSLMEYMVMC